MGDALRAGSPGAIDFAALFGRLPSPYMILDRELRYVEANDAYCATVERPRDALIGVDLFEAFPDDGESGRRLRASLQRVLDTGEPDTLPLIPYAIERPRERGGGLEMRYWSAVHIPIQDDAGVVQFVVQNTVDVTELHQLRTLASGRGGASDPAPGEKDVLLRAREAEAANRSLSRETEGLRDLFMQAPGFMAVLAGPDLVFRLANTAYQALVGDREVLGKPLTEALPEVEAQGFVALLKGVMADGRPHIGRATPVQLQRQHDEGLEERFVDFIFQPIRGADGAVTGVFVEGSDITDRVLAERQQKLLVDELNHRVKNTLATVQAIAQQTRRASPDPLAFHTAFEARLLALSATHDLLTATNWRGAALRDVLLVELGPYGENQYRLDGPKVELTPAEALAMGLIIHELATNAAKYGALSTPDGCVGVEWQVTDGSLNLKWQERGGPPVAPPVRRGFGSRLIERSLQGQLGGYTKLNFEYTGLVCLVVLPLAAA